MLQTAAWCETGAMFLFLEAACMTDDRAAAKFLTSIRQIARMYEEYRRVHKNCQYYSRVLKAHI